MKRILFFLSFYVICALFSLDPAFAAPVARVTVLEGKADVTMAGARDAIPVAVGTTVNAGDILRAKRNSKIEITFSDGNIIRLAELTRVRITQYQPEEGRKSYINLFRGKTQGVVDKLKKGATFEVHTPTAVCGVRGTTFYSSYQNGQSSFIFQSGIGYGYNLNRPDQVVVIPAKVFMVVPGTDKAPLLRPATEPELDKHYRDTTPVDRPKEKAASPTTPAAAPTDAASLAVNQALFAKQETIPPSTMQNSNPVPPQAPVIYIAKDNTPPSISFLSGPAALTNLEQATFSYEANEQSDFQYRIDNGAWKTGPASAQSGSTTVTVSRDETVESTNHTFELKATDALGNSSTKTYSWTTDFKPPTVTLSPQSAFPKESQQADVSYQLSSSEESTTYEYKKDGGDYEATGADLSISSLTAGSHEVTARGTDKAGNVGNGQSSSFTLSRYDDSGGKSWSTGGMTSTNVQVRYAGVAGNSWGSWELKDDGTGTPASSWDYYAGKANDTTATAVEQMSYWVEKAAGTAANGAISGSSSSHRYMNWNIHGQGSNGSITGSYGNGAWSATDTGKGKYTENNLKFASLVGQWNSDGTAKAGRLSYTQEPAITFAEVTSAKLVASSRIDLSWNNSNASVASYTWVPSRTLKYRTVYTGGDSGVGGYNKFVYPYAGLSSPTTGSEQILLSELLPGDTYFAVKNNNATDPGGTESLYKVYFSDYGTVDESSKELLHQITGKSFTSTWWNIYRITAAADPSEPYRLYVADSTGSYGFFQNSWDNIAIRGMMGGTDSIVTGPASVPIRLIGAYEGGTDSYNRSWGEDLVAYDPSSSQGTKYLTKDGGTYFGKLGGIIRPSQERLQGIISAFYIDPAGKLGLLKGSFGSGEGADPKGVLYPGIKMWEADGAIERYEMAATSLHNPASLQTQWYYVAPPAGKDERNDSWYNNNTDLNRFHYSSLNKSTGLHKGLLVFFDDFAKEQLEATTRHENYFDMYGIRKDGADPYSGAENFGVWSWETTGKYDVMKKKWVANVDPRAEEENSGYGFRGSVFAYGNDLWTNGIFTGRAFGFMSLGIGGATQVLTGEMIGTYNEGLKFYNAGATGSFIETGRYLDMVDSASPDYSSTLSALGYPAKSDELALDTASKNLTGAIASDSAKAVQINNLRMFSLKGTDDLKLLTSTSLSGGTGLVKGALYPVTSGTEELPVYGHFNPKFISSNADNSRTVWSGEIDAWGAFKMGDGTIKQLDIWGQGAGTNSSVDASFSGTFAGGGNRAELLSLITTDTENQASLRYYDGTGYEKEGYLKGLLVSGGPVNWPENASYPRYINLSSAGVWFPESSSQDAARSHVFWAKVWPQNFEQSTAGNPIYTTLQGHSFWGYLMGTHRYMSNDNRQDELHPLITALFIDNNQQAGIIYGRFYEQYNNGGFDRTNKVFRTWTTDYQMPVVQDIDAIPTGGTTAAQLANAMNTQSANHQTLSYWGDSIRKGDDSAIGRFDNGQTATSSYIYMPAARDIKQSWIGDTNGDWGIWRTDFYGTYDSDGGSGNPPTHDHWFGELVYPRNDINKDAKGATNIVIGNQWQDNRFEGEWTGAYFDITQSRAVTGILSGLVLGTYDPGKLTYQAVAGGTFLETAKFVNLAETASGREALRNLNIPCVSVGSVSLTGTNATYGLNVNMNNVNFYAHSTGAVPQIWATKDVSGSYTTAPVSGVTVGLSGNGGYGAVTADFKVKSWNDASTSGKWSAGINSGQGSIGSTVNLTNLKFGGMAAGSVNTTAKTFTGTGAGVAGKQ